MTRNALLKEWSKRAMDWELCWERNRWGMKASWRRGGSDQGGAERYWSSWKRGINDHRARNNISWEIVAIQDSQRDIASSNDVENGDHEHDEETQLGQLSEDDEPYYMMGTITKTVQQRMERFWEKQINLDKFTRHGCEDAHNYFRERDKKYSTSELRVTAVVHLQTDDDAASPAPTPFAELMECRNIVPVISQMLHGTSRPGRGHIRQYSCKPQSNLSIMGVAATVEYCWQRFGTFILGPGPNPKRTIANLAVLVDYKPEMSTRVWFDDKLPLRLKWVGCQWVAQRVHL